MEKKIDIIKDVLDEKFWWYDRGGTVHYVCHCHFNSPYETDSSCGNCDGSACADGDGKYPKKYREDSRFEFCPTTNDYADILRKHIDNDIAEDLAYLDGVRCVRRNGVIYSVVDPRDVKRYPWASDDEEVKAFFDKIYTVDEDLVKFFTSDPKYLCRADAGYIDAEAVCKDQLPGPNYYDSTEARHIHNQVKMYNAQF